MIYVFYDPALGTQGGLGDRLGGLISAFAFAMRTNRTLLIYGDNSFESAFKPFSPDPNNQKTWTNWDWSGLPMSSYRRHDNDVLNHLRCVNPKPHKTECALDHDTDHKIVKYRSNRAYLCRWNALKDLVDANHLKATLGVDDSTDLFEVGGCMLRLAMTPTDKLWDAIDASLEEDTANKYASFETAAQIGIHFRCGDSSFATTTTTGTTTVNKECVYDPSIPWKGTSFFDDHSIDSPIDAAKCARSIAQRVNDRLAAASKTTTNNSVLVFIASDYAPSSQQINRTLNWPYSITPPQGCHVDLQSSDKCTLQTSVHWMLLALSDHIVMQSMQFVESHLKSPYTDTEVDIASLESPPISAFSRFAALYSLSPNVISFGSHCDPVNQVKLSRQTQGNWVCKPKMFF